MCSGPIAAPSPPITNNTCNLDGCRCYLYMHYLAVVPPLLLHFLTREVECLAIADNKEMAINKYFLNSISIRLDVIQSRQSLLKDGN